MFAIVTAYALESTLVDSGTNYYHYYSCVVCPGVCGVYPQNYMLHEYIVHI